jgi:hypothetical protein
LTLARRRFRYLLSLISAIIILEGCLFSNLQPIRDSAPPSTPAPTIPTIIPTQIPAFNPLTVNVTLDESQALAEVIKPEGGELTLTGSGNVRFTLTIPNGALAEEKQIRILPVTSIQGLPMSGGLVGSVQIEPEGLTLLQPATLKIEIPAGSETKALVGFSYKGQGKEFHLHPFKIDPGGISFQITRLGGYGAGAATQTDLDAQAERLPDSPIDQVNQQAAGLLAQAYMSGQALPEEKLAEIYGALFNDILLPRLKAAEMDDAGLEGAMSDFLEVAHQVTWLGLQDRLQKELLQDFASLSTALKNSFEQAAQRCVQDTDISQGRMMLSRLKEIALLSTEPGFDASGYGLQEKSEPIQSCFTFQLQLDSTVTWNFVASSTIKAQNSAYVTLKLDPQTMTYNGHGRLEYKGYSLEFTGDMAEINQYCKVSQENASASFDVVDSKIDFGVTDSRMPAVQIAMMVVPSPSGANINYSCEIEGSAFTQAMPEFFPEWYNGFILVHEGQKLENWGPDGVTAYAFTDWQTAGGQVLAKLAQTYNAISDAGPVSEDLSMQILHTPGAN